MDLYGNYSTNKNKVLKLAQDADGNDINLDGFIQQQELEDLFMSDYLRQWGGVDSSDGTPYYIVGGDEELMLHQVLKLRLTTTQQDKLL